MNMSLQMEAVYRRVDSLQQRATELPMRSNYLEGAIQDLYLVLEELLTAEEELQCQNQELLLTRQAVDLERQRFQTLFEFSPDGYLVTDTQGQIHQANRAAAHLLAIAPEYLLGKPLFILIDDAYRPLFQVQLALFHQPIHDWEVYLKPHQGEPFPVSVSMAHRVIGGDGNVELLWSLRDSRARKMMEQHLQTAYDELEQRVQERTAELLEANARLEQEIIERRQVEQRIFEQAALIDIATDAILVCDLQNRIQFWSRGAERLYGWTIEEALGKNIHPLLYPGNGIQENDGLAETFQQGFWRGELEQQTKFKQSIIAATSWTLVCDPSGHPTSILMVNTDITEKKKLEEQFYRAQRIESLGALAGGIAHDLNNILTPILGFTHILSANLRDQSSLIQNQLKAIQTSAKRGEDLVKQILMFAQGSECKRIPFSVNNLITDLTGLLRQTFPKSIKIQTGAFPADLNRILAAPIQIHQILMNLCVNARDAMPQGGVLTISVANSQVDATHGELHAMELSADTADTKEGDYVVLTVADTGCGIPKAILDRIFEPFFTTKASGHGTGLGLSTVLGIVKSSGGFIQVSSQSGLGTVFKIYLPALPDDQHRSVDPRSAER